VVNWPNMTKRTVGTASLVIFLALAPFCLPLACIGLFGLTDTSEQEHREMALAALAVWLPTLLPALFTCVPWEGLGRLWDRAGATWGRTGKRWLAKVGVWWAARRKRSGKERD